MTWAPASTVTDLQSLSDEALRRLVDRRRASEPAIAGRCAAAVRTAAGECGFKARFG